MSNKKDSPNDLIRRPPSDLVNKDEAGLAKRGLDLALELTSSTVVCFASYDAYLYVLDAKTGKEKWKFKTAYGPHHMNIVLKDDFVYCKDNVYSGENPNNGYLYAINIKKCYEKWKFCVQDTELDYPCIYDEMVCCMGKSQQLNCLYFLDKQTGKEITKIKSNDVERYISSPSIADMVVYFAGQLVDGPLYLFSINIQTGQEMWRFKINHEVNGAPTISDGLIIFGCYLNGDKYLHALDIQTGREVWRFKTMDGPGSPPVVSGGVVFFGAWDGYFYAVDIKTGEEKWRFMAVENPFRVSPPAIADGVVFFAGRGTLYALNAETGEEKWRFFDDFWSSIDGPAVAEGTVYSAGYHVPVKNNYYLYALDTQTGRVKWKFGPHEDIRGIPVIG